MSNPHNCKKEIEMRLRLIKEFTDLKARLRGDENWKTLGQLSCEVYCAHWTADNTVWNLEILKAHFTDLNCGGGPRDDWRLPQRMERRPAQDVGGAI